MKSIALSVILLLAVSGKSRSQIINQFETDTVSANQLVASSFLTDYQGWLADNAGNIWYTGDAGENWSVFPTGLNFLKLDFADAFNGYGLTSTGLYKSTDGGVTWTGVALPGAVGRAILFLSSETGFVSGKGVIYKTEDGGNSWSSFATSGTSMNDYYFINDLNGVAVSNDDTEKSIWRTTDGGDTWTNVFSQEDFYWNAVWFTDANTGWAAGYFERTGYGRLPAIYRTSDGGATWVNAYINDNPGDIKGEEFLDIRFRNKNLGLAIASYSENVFTIDGGVTWRSTYGEQGDIIPSYGVYKTLDGVHTMYLAGKKGFLTRWK